MGDRANHPDRTAPVRILIDPTDDVRVTASLLERHDPDRGLVVVHPTPATSSPKAFAHDLLVALDRPVTRLEAEHLTGMAPTWQAVAAWMVTDQVKDLLVLRADRLSASTWNRLLGLCIQSLVAAMKLDAQRARTQLKTQRTNARQGLQCAPNVRLFSAAVHGADAVQPSGSGCCIKCSAVNASSSQRIMRRVLGAAAARHRRTGRRMSVTRVMSGTVVMVMVMVVTVAMTMRRFRGYFHQAIGNLVAALKSSTAEPRHESPP